MKTLTWKLYQYENGREKKLGEIKLPAFQNGSLVTADKVYESLTKSGLFPKSLNVALAADQWEEYDKLKEAQEHLINASKTKGENYAND